MTAFHALRIHLIDLGWDYDIAEDVRRLWAKHKSVMIVVREIVEEINDDEHDYTDELTEAIESWRKHAQPDPAT